jgi:hypothetical protein
MSALDQEFEVADVIPVTTGVAAQLFPAFPHSGTLVVLEPPYAVADHELTGYSAAVRTGGGTILLNYEHWHANPQGAIGLLSKDPSASAIALRSKVGFIKRT